MAYSLRRRLVSGSCAALVVLLGAAALWLDRRIEQAAVREFDAALSAKVHALEALTEQENGVIEFDYDAKFMPEFERAELPEFFEFWLQDGTVLRRSTRLEGDLPRGDDDVACDAILPGGRRGRVASLAFVPKGPVDLGSVPASVPTSAVPTDPGGAIADDDHPHGTAPAVVLSVGRGREHLDALLAQAHVVVFGSAALTLLLALATLWWVLRLGFRRVDAIAVGVARLDPQAAPAHVDLPPVPKELRPFVDQVHALLARARAAMQRERRFTGHVAHELRTPIAELRSLAAVAMRWPDDRAAVARYFTDVDEIAVGMEGVIADLMLLARCGAGVETARREPLALRAAIETTWADLADAARARGIRLRLDVENDLCVETDAGKLAIVLTNLLGNAVGHAVSAHAIVCRAARLGDEVRLTIENKMAKPLAREELERVSEPFWRGAPAPSRVAGHAGLGLALVAALVDLLQLRLVVAQSDDAVFVVEVCGLAPGAPPAGVFGATGVPVDARGPVRRQGA